MICTYERDIYRNQDNGFCVCQFATKDSSVPEAARGRRSGDGVFRFTATGQELPAAKEVNFEIEGSWEASKYGMQLQVEHCREIMPETTDGIRAYLASGLIKGIGPATAREIVAKFGLRSLEVIETEPERLLEVRGITEEKLSVITGCCSESRAIRNIVAYLSPFGISTKKAAKILERFGSNAVNVVRNDPFRLCAIPGFGFRTVDTIARKTNRNLADALRIRSGLLYVLKEAARAGHLYLPQDELTGSVYDLLNAGFEMEIVCISEIREQLGLMLEKRKLAADIGRVYIPLYRDAEITTARNALALTLTRTELEMNLEKELAVSQEKLGIALSDRQADAVRMCLANNISIITGGPGTGKTTVLKVVLDIFQRVCPDEPIQLVAPTGRASRRMVDATGYPDASTLHSALGLTPAGDDGYDTKQGALEADLIVVDEASMIDMLLAAELFKAVDRRARLVLVGDPDQLPSVGAGNVLRELLRSGLIPSVHLDVVYRQEEGSRIALNAHAINSGEKKLLYGDDFVYLNAEDETEAAGLVISTYLAELKAQGPDVQILTPMRTRGACSVETLNTRIREIVNPARAGKMEIKRGARVWRVGDKVMQTVNRLPDGVSNGDIGKIVSIAADQDQEIHVLAEFGSRKVRYDVESLAQLELAYATTVHKSQGSEYQEVILPLFKSQSIMLRRNLVYTAISRAKAKLTLIGQIEALHIASGRNDVDTRYTLLADRMVSLRHKFLS